MLEPLTQATHNIYASTGWFVGWLTRLVGRLLDMRSASFFYDGCFYECNNRAFYIYVYQGRSDKNQKYTHGCVNMEEIK